ncbi:RNA pol II transcription cofactor [Blastocladiella emersonii ATCC 22665]|nr:RNA pol II transcription cofactor [Blastocladiella emersonii ATCC 22665]
MEVDESFARTVARIVAAREQIEGVGVTVRRTLGTVGMPNLDPFLLLDDFAVDPPAGFADHPHRGFETVSYLLSGSSEHEDFAGHRGRLGPGDLQWMTAGRGIVHAEVPTGKTTATGLQLWVNLPASEKMCEPRYQELRGANLPRVSPSPGIDVIVLAGDAFGAAAKVRTATPMCYFDVTVQPGSRVAVPLPPAYNALVYVLSGAVVVSGSREAKAHECIVLDSVPNGATASHVDAAVAIDATCPARLVVLGGEPINEPIVRHGPFVMNTYDEIREAMDDYHNGRNGFERAPRFRSKIGKRVAAAAAASAASTRSRSGSAANAASK